MNERQSENHRRIFAAIGIILLLVTAAYCLSGRSSTDSASGLQADTDKSVDSIKEQSKDAISKFDAAGRELDSAGAAAGRAEELIGASQERAKENATGIAECRRIVGECKKITQDIQRIMREADEATEPGTQTGG